MFPCSIILDSDVYAAKVIFAPSCRFLCQINRTENVMVTSATILLIKESTRFLAVGLWFRKRGFFGGIDPAKHFMAAVKKQKVRKV